VIFISKYKEFVKENYFLIFFEKWKIKNLCQSEQALIKVFFYLNLRFGEFSPKKIAKQVKFTIKKTFFSKKIPICWSKNDKIC
jgi:hypothetical protein